MPKKIKIMIADDHAVLRHSLSEILSESKDISVIGQGSNGKEIIKLVRNQKPDIIVTDIDMPEVSGFELARSIKTDYPDIKIIFLSMYYSPYYSDQVMKDGISACLPKECSFDVLLDAIRTVYLTGGYNYRKEIANCTISEMMAEKTLEKLQDQVPLNHRENEVLTHMCNGKQNREIAEILNLSVATVDSYRQSIYKKTGISSLALLVKYAIRHGITPIN